MAKAFGIVNFAGNHIAVEGMREYRPVGAFFPWTLPCHRLHDL